MAARSKARKRALDYLYAGEMRAESPLLRLEGAVADGEGHTNPYTDVLVTGVVEHQDRIDGLLSAYAQGWTLQRMPAVDRNILRLGVWEILWGDDDVPAEVAVSEALGLARDLSTDDSPQFVNGVLAAIARDHQAGTLREPEEPSAPESASDTQAEVADEPSGS